MATIVVIAGFGGGCSSGTATTSERSATTLPVSGANPPPSTVSARPTGSTVTRPEGLAADLSEEITGQSTPFMGEAAPANNVPGSVEREYVAAGIATDYKAPAGMPADGKWNLAPDTTAAYRTRIVVRRPADMNRFSGTVVVEWLNVSGGLDGNPDYTSLAEEITRKGHVWVGVSAQLIGVEGGPVIVRAPGAEDLVGKGLKVLDPARYSSLHHPGDGYSYDIYTQVARALREGGPALDGVKPDVLLAAGESQSAVALTTYYNGVQPLVQAYDGFFVHSRAFVALPLVEPGKYADLAGGMTTTPDPVLLRGDLDAPVLELQTEGDVVGILNSLSVRQPDTDRFRLWEVAGASHADRHLVSEVIADKLDCGKPINNAPMHLVAKAGLRALDTWVRTGQAPATAPRMEVAEGENPAIRRNADGIGLGGIRTPVMDVPVDILTGTPPPNPDFICILMGSTEPLPNERLAGLYQNKSDYEAKYRDAADATIKAGFVLEDDRDALIGFSQPDRVAS